MGSKFTDSAPFEYSPSNEKRTPEEGTGSQDNRLRFENCAGRRPDTRDFSFIEKKMGDRINVNI